MKQKLVYKEHVACPRCDELHVTDHLKPSEMEYKWYCNGCHYRFKFKLYEGFADIETMEDRSIQTLVTLVLPTNKGTLKLEVDGIYVCENGENPSAKDIEEHHRYFYSEHTCPSNCLRSVEEVFLDGEPDPHGLFEYISTKIK